MTGHGLVIDQRTEAELGQTLGAKGNLKRPRARAVGRWAIVTGGGVGFAETWIWLRYYRSFGTPIEQRSGAFFGVAKDLFHVGHDQFATLFVLFTVHWIGLFALHLLDAVFHAALCAAEFTEQLVH